MGRYVRTVTYAPSLKEPLAASAHHYQITGPSHNHDIMHNIMPSIQSTREILRAPSRPDLDNTKGQLDQLQPVQMTKSSIQDTS